MSKNISKFARPVFLRLVFRPTRHLGLQLTRETEVKYWQRHLHVLTIFDI